MLSQTSLELSVCSECKIHSDRLEESQEELPGKEKGIPDGHRTANQSILYVQADWVDVRKPVEACVNDIDQHAAVVEIHGCSEQAHACQKVHDA